MRKVLCCALLAALAAANSGCVVALGNKGMSKGCATGDRYPVSHNGDIYIVDVDTGQVMKVDPQKVTTATSFTVTRIETDGDDD